ncbi:precorrin-6y C5,15-methyltransferase (decarboxylating) subunit CbiE [Phenylobacterium sp. LjRoot225]|uniref:precorrin-6y C5,15-methyltransferase (decarboxylating) subunit CbiE n=1 Tax=Phenylobacterium sp. LjRoot225 TaxID=3342285 RepID=UPI003ECC292C
MTGSAANAPWLAIVGIGEDGVEGLGEAARALVRGAELVVGGERHLALAAPLIRGETLAWPSPLSDAVPQILGQRGQPTVVLASGDPFCFGVGALLARHVAETERLCLPAPSAFALACARLGWSAQESSQVSLCGRPLEPLAPLLQPGRRLMVLSADESTPAALAAYLAERGFGPSRLHVLEALGGPHERRRATTAAAFDLADIQPLNLVAVEVAAGPGARIIPLACGLPDEAFEHDGLITKREIRAVTLSAMAPCAGELLWDVGGGSGSIAIEWMLRHPDNRAIMLEPKADRAARAARNACQFGVSALRIVPDAAPEGLTGLPTPDAVFLGGGASDPAVIEAAWTALRSGGRLVANAVTVETEAALLQARARLGGGMTRLSVERLEPIGGMEGFRPARTVTQWTAVKP